MTPPKTDPAMSDPIYLNLDRRLRIHALWLAALTIGVATFYQAWQFIVSFVIGAMLSMLNFSWMKQGIDRVVALQLGTSAALAQSNRKTLLKVLLRYALLGGTLYVIFRFRFMDFRGALWGLFLFVGAVLSECVFLIGRSLLKEGNGRT